MRRKEFEVKDRQKMEEVLERADVGYLAFHGPDGWPRITALNFWYDGRILWHGAVAGERFESLKRDPRATFSAVSLQLYPPTSFPRKTPPRPRRPSNPWPCAVGSCPSMNREKNAPS